MIFAFIIYILYKISLLITGLQKAWNIGIYIEDRGFHRMWIFTLNIEIFLEYRNLHEIEIIMEYKDLLS